MFNLLEKFKVYILSVVLSVVIMWGTSLFIKNTVLEDEKAQLTQNLTSTTSLLSLCRDDSKVENVEVKFHNKEPKETKYEPTYTRNPNNSTFSIQFFRMPTEETNN